MAASAIRACGAGRKAPEVRKVLDTMRAELKKLGKALQPPKKTPWPEFNKRAASMRKRHLDRLKRILSPDQYKKFENWTRSAKDSYTRRFFGLGG